MTRDKSMIKIAILGNYLADRKPRNTIVPTSETIATEEKPHPLLTGFLKAIEKRISEGKKSL